MPTTVRTHPWWVAGLAALAPAATVGVLALARAFDRNPCSSSNRRPAATPKATFRRRSWATGTAKHGPSGDTKGDVTAETRSVGQELVLEDRAAGAGH